MRQRDEDCTAQPYSTHTIDSEVRESGYQSRWSRPLRRPPRRESPIGTVRRARVHRKSHELEGWPLRLRSTGSPSITPTLFPPSRGEEGAPTLLMVRLTGLWLEDAGFLQGQPYEVEVSPGKLVLRTV